MSPMLGRPTAEPAVGKASNGRFKESVWDYPRPPQIEPVDRPAVVIFAGHVIAECARPMRIIETAGAPTVYMPPDAVDLRTLRPTAGGSFCEWKGSASYFDVKLNGDAAARAAWSYRNPTAAFASISGWISFYPALVECRLGDEVVEPQPGGFYGGWVTAEICGPIKGSPGSTGW